MIRNTLTLNTYKGKFFIRNDKEVIEAEGWLYGGVSKLERENATLKAEVKELKRDVKMYKSKIKLGY